MKNTNSHELKKQISEIKNFSQRFEKFNEDELASKIQELKQKAKQKGLINILTEYYALVQEVSRRTIGLKHFDNQLLAGILLNQGKIVEMKTGEGKTLASSLPIALNALSKKGVHVVTVNEYLAERDQKWMGKIFENLNLTVGLIKNTMNFQTKQKNYAKDISYLTNSELVFDFLKDNSSYNLDDLMQRPLNFCLVDEIDSVLIDEARTPLILSAFTQSQNQGKLYLAKFIADRLEKDIDFELDEKRKDINLTDLGYQKLSEVLGKNSLYESSDPWILQILNALKASYLFKLNKDYILLNNKIAIVDEFTGRVMEDRRWGMGIHEAIEIKEKLPNEGRSKTKISITYQNFFPLYPTLCGMTGTGKTAEKEFKNIYNLEVCPIPTHKKMIRQDLNDLVYQNELSKWKAVLMKSKECYEKGQPILIGTTTIEKSELLSELFRFSKIPHQVLNAKPENLIRENEIIAQAGKQYAVTIATNMAGRGTDIILGGNIAFQIKEKFQNFFLKEDSSFNEYNEEILFLKKEYENKEKLLEKIIQNLPYSLNKGSAYFQSFYKKLYQKYFSLWQKENQQVKDLGGLFVLGTEKHENRRIDNQLRGRAGRQGDPGFSQFFVSLEDDLIKIFGGDNIRNFMSYFLKNQDESLESGLLSKSLEKAQKKIEDYNYDLRRNIFEYDNILNTQREVFFKLRADLLQNSQYEDLFLRYLEEESDFQKEKLKDKGIISERLYKKNWIKLDLLLTKSNLYQKSLLKSTKSMLLLDLMDSYWTQHIEEMNYVKDTISWKSYGQQNPLIEYNFQSLKSFQKMFEQIKDSMIYCFIRQALYY